MLGRDSYCPLHGDLKTSGTRRCTHAMPLPLGGAVVNPECPQEWAGGCPDVWLSIILGVSGRHPHFNQWPE